MNAEGGQTVGTRAIRHTLHVQRKRVRTDGRHDSVRRAETLIAGERVSGVPSTPRCMCGPFEGRPFSIDSSHITTKPQHKTVVLMIRDVSLHNLGDSSNGERRRATERGGERRIAAESGRERLRATERQRGGE